MDNPNHDDRPISYYQVGTIELTKGSQTVIGHETFWLSDLPCNYNIPRPQAGNLITIDNANFYIIKDVVSDTEIEIATPYNETSDDRVSYAVITSTFVDANSVGVDIAKLNAELVAGLTKIIDIKNQADTTKADMQTIKSDTEDLKNEAQQSAQDAEAANQSAQTHEQNAQQIKTDTEAIKQQTDAIHQATNLVLVNTQNVKDDTQVIHDQTEQLKTEANQWSDKAHEWATKQHGVVVDNGEYSSKHWAEESASSASASHTSEVESQKWANNPENQVVSGNEYSAKHYDAKAKEALASANTAASKAEAARDQAAVSALKTQNAAVYRGDWQPASGLPQAPVTNSYWYVAATETEPSNPNIHWQEGDSLAYMTDGTNSRWARFTGEPLTPHTPGPLRIDNDLLLKPEKAIRFEAVDNDPDPIYAVGMHTTAQKKNRLLFGDYTKDDIAEIVIAIPDANNLQVSEQLDQNNDWSPVPNKTYPILTTKNGVPKSGGTFTGAVKCAVAPVDDSDLINLKFARDESGRLIGVLNGEIANLKTMVGTKLTKAEADKLYMRPEYATLQWERIVGGDITKAITPAHLQALDLSTNIQNDQKYVKLGGSSMTGDLHFASGKGISDSGQNHLLTWVGTNFYSGNVSHTLNLRSKTEPVLTIGSHNYSFYHTGHKPTAADVGALAAGSKAVDSAKLEGKTKAQVVAEARSGLLTTSGKAADSDKIDGIDSSQLFRRIDNTTDYKSTANIATYQTFSNKLPDGLTGAYTYGELLTVNTASNRLRIYAPHHHNDNKHSALYFSTGYGTDIKPWEQILSYRDADARYLAKGGKAHDSDLLDGINSSSFVRSDANDTKAGYLEMTSRAYGITGVYDSKKTQAIWVMGKAYPSDGNGANFGKLYGLAYKHTNNPTGGSMAGGHQMVWCENGVPKSSIGENIWTSGSYWGGKFYSYGKNAIDGNDSWLRFNAENKFTSGIYCGSSLLRTDGYISVGDWVNGNKTTKMKKDFYDSTWGGNSTSAFNARCADSNGAHWLIASYYDATNIRSGIQVLSNSDGRMRFYTNRRGHYVEMSGGAILAQGNITAYSDKRLKTNLERIPNALDKVMNISGYTFDRTDGNYPRQAGVIAQEIEKVLPEVVSEDESGIKHVAYGNIVGLLIEAVKDLKAEVDYLKGVKQ
ncbi:TPA: tail fiber domain-containing protein [Vibrio harveyi]